MSWYINPVSNIDDCWRVTDEFDTKEEAIAAGVHEYQLHLQGAPTELFDNDYNYPDPPTSLFEIGEALKFVPLIDSDWIIEQVTEQADWQCGEIAEDWLQWDAITKEQREELQENVQKVFDDWLKKHNLEPTFYNVVNIEIIDAKDYV